MKQLACDVLVLGSGGAGLAAGVTAAEAGKRVVLLEKNTFFGGATNTVIVVRVLRDDPAFVDRAFQVHMEMTHWMGNPELVRAWLERDAKLAQWMAQRGVEFCIDYVTTLDSLGRQDDPLGGFPKGHLIAERAFLKGEGNGHGGALLVRALLERLEALGGRVYRGAPAVSLKAKGGRITGALARTRDGQELDISAPAVVLATAGFNENAEMIREYSGFDYTLDPTGTCTQGDFFFVWPYTKLMGDGLRMAWEAGAVRGPIGVAPFAHIPGPGVIGRVPWNTRSQLRIVQEQPYLWVNQRGRRFMDESIITDHFTSGRVVAQQPGKCAYLIFDEATREHMEREGLDYTYFIFPAGRLTDLEGDMCRVQAAGNRHVFIADGIVELCRQTGLPPDALADTVARYNDCCDAGRDSLFSKDPRFLRPVRTGKLYCIRVYTSAYQTIGGLKVDGGARVLREDGGPLPGLLAAGDIIAANLFGQPPICGIGNAGIALSTGILAGESAVLYCEKEGSP